MSHYENNLAEKDLKRDLETDQPLHNTPSVAHGNQVHDDVFGEITDEGPNYRAVRLPFPNPTSNSPILTDILGRLDRYRRSHDENPSRSRRPVHPRSLRRPRHRPRNYLSHHHRRYNDLV